MNKKIIALAAALLCFTAAGLFSQEAAAVEKTSDTGFVKYISAAFAVSLACIAGGMAVGKIGAAAMGAMSENAELSGKALPFVGLAEGICLWGFLVALLIIIL